MGQNQRNNRIVTLPKYFGAKDILLVFSKLKLHVYCLILYECHIGVLLLSVLPSMNDTLNY